MSENPYLTLSVAPILWVEAAQTVCDWGEPCWARCHSKEIIKNLIELSDTETYKGMASKQALILLLSALYSLCIQTVWSCRGFENTASEWQKKDANLTNLYNKYVGLFLM